MKSIINDKGEFHLEHNIFIFDGNLKSLLPVNAEKEIPEFIKNLLILLEMERLGPLEIFAATDIDAPGFSFIQPITTSHITGHYFEKPGKFPHLHFDVYSCKKFLWQNIIANLDNFFHLANWSSNFISRSIDSNRDYIEITGNGSEFIVTPLVRMG